MATKKKTSLKKTAKKAAPYIIVRTYSAGVHCGRLVSKNGKETVLANARRIWSWTGRYTLHEIANHGVGAGSKVSEVVSTVELTETIERIPCTAEAVANLESAKWG